MLSTDDLLFELPFYGLDSEEFLKATGAWVHYSSASSLDSKDLFQDIIESPDRESEFQDYRNYVESKYYTSQANMKLLSKKHGFSEVYHKSSFVLGTRSHCDLRELEELMNSELDKVKEWCDANKLYQLITPKQIS